MRVNRGLTMSFADPYRVHRTDLQDDGRVFTVDSVVREYRKPRKDGRACVFLTE